MELLKVDNVSFTYQNKHHAVRAVKNVSYTFEPGKTYAIVGKSGSGKTTLLSLLAGLELPTEGAVRYEGRSTEEMNCDVYRRDHTAVIYQNYNLFPLLTAEENVRYPLKLKKLPREEAKRLSREQLHAVGIREDEYRRFPAQLSGGQQQRVAIARALAAGSRIILADEPTGNLDISNAEQVVQILLHLAHQEGRCVIVVTHDLEIAALMDVVLTIRDGAITETEE